MPAHTALESMEEIRAEFIRQRGISWDQATSDQKKEFLQSRKTEKNAELYNDMNPGPGVEILNDVQSVSEERGEAAQYYIRESFRKHVGKDWESAAEEEQNTYKKEYEIRMKKLDKQDEDYIRKQQQEEKRRARERRIEEKRREKIEKARIQREKIKQRKLRREQKEEQLRLLKAKKKMEELRKKSKRR